MANSRQNRPVRMGPAGIAKVQAIADRDGVSWSEAVRRLLAFALRPERPMPPGWHPNHVRRDQ